MTVPIALTIAGSDSGGGAGIQADLKTFQELGVFGTSVLTAVTAQNTMGVQGVYPMEREAVKTQLESVGADFLISALKTGMLFDADIIEETALSVTHFGWKNLVVDPVMIAKGGAPLLRSEAAAALKELLIPHALVVTPNIPEAEVLAGMSIVSEADCVRAAEKMLALGVHAVVMKGGHREGESKADDLYMDQTGKSFIMSAKRIDTKDTHGTGCTFAAALTAGLAKGKALPDAVVEAKKFIHAAISNGLGIGNGHGPTNHWAFSELKDEGGMDQEVNVVAVHYSY
ncbi:MAG TPA: bifunctional hydroxymethylpyrimidine kinase/phosphomethylpyrimidine kinase [Bacillaceae bacterium]